MRRAWHACAAYTAITLVATWPLAAGLASDVAWDLGDSLLNMWILSWDCEQLLAILRGDLSRLATFFDANIFHPAPLTLAYSEHLLPQALQVLPIYAVTGNPILCYNLLFLSTFVLSGLGMYLFVRELTGNPLAAFVAGLLFAFAPYRLVQSSHLQVLSSQWMPFVLYGLRRYFDTARLKPLLWAAIALAVQALSCGYYLLYFTPFAIVYALWEMVSRRAWGKTRTWLQLAAAGLLAAAIVAPFLLPYAELRNRYGMTRPLHEVARMSADVYSYATTHPGQPLWGKVMQALPKPEGELFPGLVPVFLAVIGLIFRLKPEAIGDKTATGDNRTGPSFRLKAEATENPEATGVNRTGSFRLKAEATAVNRTGAREATRDVSASGVDSGGFRLQAEGQAQSSKLRRVAVMLFAVIAVIHAAGAAAAIVMRRIVVDLGPFTVRMNDVTQLLLRAAAAFAVVLILSPSARRRTATFLSDRGFFLAALLAAFWLSLGPAPMSLGRPLDLVAPYAWLYDYVPGFEGVRAPARLAMIVTLMLAVLGGFGAAALGRRRAGRAVTVVLAALFLLEGTMVPFLVNGTSATSGYHAPDARIYRPDRAPRIYIDGVRAIGPAVLADLPLGPPDFDVRAVYYSTVHWAKLLNGYSGFFPPAYGRLIVALSEIPRHPELSMQVLRDAGTTHVVVHEGAYLGNEGAETSAALRTLGAAELYRDGSEVLLELPR